MAVIMDITSVKHIYGSLNELLDASRRLDSSPEVLFAIAERSTDMADFERRFAGAIDVFDVMDRAQDLAGTDELCWTEITEGGA